MEKNSKNLFETMVENQSQALNNWLETTQKMQKAFLGGQLIEKGSELYNEWINNQMNILSKATNELKDKTMEAGQNATKTFNSEEFYKNWFDTQMNFVKQLMEANQQFYNQILNYGKPASEVNESYNQINSTFNTLYSNWQKTLTTMYNTILQNMQNMPMANQNTFTSMFNGINLYNQFQEIFTPWIKSLANGQVNAETLKSWMDPSKVKEITEKMFASFFNYPNTKEMMETYTKAYESFFNNNTSISKELMENIRNTWSQFPSLISGDFAKLNGIYNQFYTLIHNAYGPFMRLMAETPEKRNAELIIETTNKFAQFTIKQAQLNYLLYTTTQRSFEKTIEFITEKIKNGTEIKSTQQLFLEWLSIAETVFLELFNSEEYSKIKGEVLAEGSSLRKLIAKQIESYFENTPFIFRSEMDELYKTIHDLKKKVQSLETRLAINNVSAIEIEEEKSSKSTTTRKK